MVSWNRDNQKNNTTHINCQKFFYKRHCATGMQFEYFSREYRRENVGLSLSFP